MPTKRTTEGVKTIPRFVDAPVTDKFVEIVAKFMQKHELNGYQRADLWLHADIRLSITAPTKLS